MKKTRVLRAISVCIVLVLAAPFAMANSIGVGIGRATEFSGSNDYQLQPNAAFEIDTRFGVLKNNQIGVQLNITKNKPIETGPIIRFNSGRNDTVTDSVIAALPDVTATTELGWFLGSSVRLERFGINTKAIAIGQISVIRAVGDGHEGMQISGSLGLVIPVNPKLRLVPSVSFNHGDDNYMAAFYGVNSAAAQTSGLSEFSATGGMENTQLALFAVRTINPSWSVSGAIAMNTLKSDAALSPITARGSSKNRFTGFAVNYHF